MSRRVPVQLQLGSRECGAACLAMVLSHHGRPTTVAEVSERIDIGRDGADAATLAAVGRSYGLRVQGYKVEPDQLPQVPLPAIAHWNFNHFLVLERVGRRGVEVVDPAGGRRRLSAQEVDAGLTGVVLVCEPGPEFRKSSGPKRAPWRNYLRHALWGGGVPAILGQILLATLILQLLALALPLATQRIVDTVIPAGKAAGLPSPATILGTSLVAWTLAVLLANLLRGVLLLNLQARLDSRLMLGFFEHLLRLPYRFFEQRAGGDLLMRVNANSLIREMLTSPTLSLFLDGGFVLVALAVLASASPRFALAAAGVGAVQIAVLLLTTRRLHDLMQRDLQARAEQESYLVETLRGIATLKATGGEERAFDVWSRLFFRHLNVALERGRLTVEIDTVLATLRTAAPLALVALGTERVLAGAMTLGVMLGCLALATAFLGPLSALVSNAQQLQVVGAHLDRILDVLNAAPEEDVTRVRVALDLSKPRLDLETPARIELDDVWFRYHERAPWALQSVSLSIEAGEKIALVGRTGSGKSTLGLLLLGFYPPQRGAVRWDGLLLSELDLVALRRQVGVVLQEPQLWSGSIRSNLAFYDPELPMAEIERAARLAAIDEEISAMPMGYETLLSEGGSSLSGGQRQRIALARALAHRPAVLLLDEATSQLDAATERIVDRNLTALACTRIVIAHRLSTVENADRIVVLDAGRIVEVGRHGELLARGGAYADLLSAQLGSRARPSGGRGVVRPFVVKKDLS